MIHIYHAPSATPIDYLIYLGPWYGRLCLSPHGSFALSHQNGRIERIIRRVWTGWSRFDGPDPCPICREGLLRTGLDRTVICDTCHAWIPDA
jgi:hypothetical protein